METNDTGFNGFEEAKKLLDAGHNIFVTGGAGSGKSWALNELKRHYGTKLSITSTTGVSALLVNGETIHSWAGIGLGNLPLESNVYKIKNKENLFKKITDAQMLAIDEISMLDNKTFDYINATLKRVRGNTKPFGGIQVLLFGDFFQIPPVSKGKTRGCDFCFKSHTWGELNLKPVILKGTKRQNEPEFIKMLNNIRTGTVTAEDTKLLVKRDDEINNYYNTDDILHIFANNASADSYNTECFNKIQNKIYSYVSKNILYEYKKDGKTEIIQEIDIDSLPIQNFSVEDKKLIDNFNKDCKAPERLYLKAGARVMLIKNINVTSGLVNGKCGVVEELSEDSIVVKFDRGPRHIFSSKEEFTLLENERPKITRKQFPLRLAYGITVHKSQGTSLDNLIIKDFNSIFSSGQGYVALSRARTLNGLIVCNFAPEKVSADKDVIDFYNIIENGGTYTYTQQALMSDNEIKELIEIAIEENITITIEYNKLLGGAESKNILPMEIRSGKEMYGSPHFKGKPDENAFYIIARDMKKNEIRCYRLDRILNVFDEAQE